jgi:hypothetical protein
MELTTVILLRSLERVIGLLIGGFIAWLGYRLFVAIPTKPDSSGKFRLPGGAAIHLTRVGPGIFFSLFGTGIVLMSFMKPIDFKQETPAGNAVASSAKVAKSSYSGAIQSAVSSGYTKEELRGMHGGQIVFLNRMPQWLKSDLTDTQQRDTATIVPQIKLAIMETVWDDDWGDFTRFKEWVNSGEGVVPPELQKPVDYFNRSQ